MLFPWPEVGCTALFPLYSGSVVYCEIEKCSVLLFPEGHHIDDPPEIDQRRGPAEIQLQPLDQVNNWLHCRILSVCRWFFPLLRQVFFRVLRFSPLLKNQHFQIPIRPLATIRQTKNQHHVDVLHFNRYWLIYFFDFWAFLFRFSVIDNY